jgi:hypothetical protein
MFFEPITAPRRPGLLSFATPFIVAVLLSNLAILWTEALSALASSLLPSAGGFLTPAESLPYIEDECAFEDTICKDKKVFFMVTADREMSMERVLCTNYLPIRLLKPIAQFYFKLFFLLFILVISNRIKINIYQSLPRVRFHFMY